jgi:hypothetical protein
MFAPYSKGQKNDFRDAETIAEVVPERARPRAILSCSNSRLLITFFEAGALQIRLRSVLVGDMNSPCSSLWQP